MSDESASLAQAIIRGDRRALARGISRVEAGDAVGRGLIRALYPNVGGARVIGLTGPPGVGKSTLVAALIQEIRRQGELVGVLAIDPSSPISGGALLGDRIRLGGQGRDEGFFFRSLGSRGGTGALSRTTADVVCLLDAAGFPWILVETVGAGQSEVSIRELADCVIVVAAPGLGDDIQAGKAGILEIADLVVVNKADRDGADRTAAELEASFSLVEHKVPVLKTSALQRTGIVELLAALKDRFSSERGGALTSNGRTPSSPAVHGDAESGMFDVAHASTPDRSSIEDRRRKRAEARLQSALWALLQLRLEDLWSKEEFRSMVIDVADRKLDPYSAALELMKHQIFFKTLLQDSEGSRS